MRDCALCEGGTEVFFKYNLKNVSLQRVNTVLDFGRVCVCVCVCVELWTA